VSAQLYTLIIMACVVGFILMIILTTGVNKRAEYIRWGLGIECICFYSSRFTVSKQGITIVGYQEVLGGQSPILYSVVKQNWWGKTKVYGQAVIYGDYKSPNCFNRTITNIPYGEDYRIKIVGHCNISRGKFKVVTE
jgi:hypothetical protein